MIPAETNGEKRVFLETFGFQMNESDSERILGLLKDINYVRTEEPAGADLIIINTCSVRDKAEQKVYSALGRYRGLKAENPGLIIGVSGCVAQQVGARLLKRVPYLDIVFGPQNIHKLKDLLDEVSLNRSRVAAVEQNASIDEGEYGYTEPGGSKAYVSIMRGCDNFCSYCIVPFTRGREVSRKSPEIIEEITRLAGAGVKEVILLGQNVNSYGTGGQGDISFTGLLKKVSKINGIKRIRFVTSHPKDISDELIYLFNDEPRLCRHLHLPVQSGSDGILKNMRRGYTASEYMSKVSLLKKLYPDMAITSDIIVGFPGETESDFEDTMRLIKEVRFDNIFSFMYSPRPDTKAAKFDGQLPLEVRSERLKVLQEAQREISIGRNRELLGRTVEVFIEGPSKADPSERYGRTSCNRIINFPAAGTESSLVSTGCIIDVTITEVFPNSLRGMVP
ncbi:MAG: tRNA (N6-isopentenyl adenosine(37)-C2)-methylthiotransferase MiaB [Deltaproteobacteria bacterium]|nr:tRNA (N6-isopentenyl adenosine(37)-C2)-methylthiotransferase MiaB [Deltaproteobacteria bacterium]